MICSHMRPQNWYHVHVQISVSETLFCSFDVIKVVSLNQIPVWLSGSSSLLQCKAGKQESVVQWEWLGLSTETCGAVLLLRKDLQKK